MLVWNFDDLFETCEVFLVQFFNPRADEPPEDEVHFPDAAMGCAPEQPLASLVHLTSGRRPPVISRFAGLAQSKIGHLCSV